MCKTDNRRNGHRETAALARRGLCLLAAGMLAFSGAFAEGGKGEGKSGGGKSGSKSAVKGTAAMLLTDGQALEGLTVTADGTDESCVLADGIGVSLTGVTLIKADGGASSADASSFYGVNSALYALNGGTVTAADCVIEADAPNATGVFAYNGGTVELSDSTVNVTGGGAGGIQVAGGGVLHAVNCTVTSKSKAAIRSDKGGGTLTVDGGTYTSLGSGGCPAVYSTADITVNGAVLTSENSRAVIIEGKNTVTLRNCVTVGNGKTEKEGSQAANVLLYQSMSGDAQVGTSVFTASGGSLESRSGAMFFVTNTSAVISLEGVDLVNAEDGAFLIASAGRWGREGSNGGICEVHCVGQTFSGDIIVDGLSGVTLEMTDSAYTGAVAAEEGAGVSVILEGESTWTLTGDSAVTSFEGELDRVITGEYHLYVNGELIK